MPRKRSLTPAELPQKPETWALGVAQLRLWITPEDEPPSRPWVMIVLDLDHDAMLEPGLFEHAPDVEEIRAGLLKSMSKPPSGAGRPRRPVRLICNDPALAAALAPGLAEIGIACETQDLPMLPEIVKDLELTMRGGEPEHPGLLSVEGVTPELAGGVFAAAAEFYRQAPWVHLLNEQAFSLRIPADGGPTRIAVVMGNAGIEYGLAIYNDWADVEKMYFGVDDPHDALPQHGEIALFYEAIQHMPFDDLEAMENFGWEIANDQAYPVPFIISQDEETNVRRPTAEELAWLEAALRAIPPLVNDDLKPDGQGDYVPFETTVTVTTHAGQTALFAKYPAGIIPREKRPLHQPDFEWPDEEDEEWEEGQEAEDDLPFDRRMMEGAMADIAAQVPGTQPVGDKKLQKAQKLMYTAWEADNPAKRISLAHEALSISPDCADAYVLLAEEEADTVARALDLYRKGMEAGERALGPDTFEREAGYFWGILETRPYMRARQGVADCLWKLNRKEEALGHYRELLKLNEQDNQGIRYLAASLLMEMDRDGELLKLLKQFKEDAAATWLYTWALAEFRTSGVGKAADRRLKKALAQNKFVPAYLLGYKRLPNRLPPYMGWGDDAEAAHYATDYLNHWRRTPGAIQWLESKL